MNNNSHLELCAKLYASLVKNRLRELNSSDDNSQSRWIWELIQNAKDCSDENICLPPDSTKQPRFQPVKIKIIYNDDDVIFQHNGFPFNNNTLDSIMYRFSSKGGKDSVGRFGTGFMTTHTLSKIIKIDAPYIDFDGNYKYLSATIFREGKTKKQFRDEFFKMEKYKTFNDFDPNNEEHKWTKFSYHLNDQTNKKSLHLGIQSFYDNIFKTFLFCPDIESIEINNEETYKCFSYSNSIEYKDKNNYFQDNIKIEFKKLISKNENHEFIVFTVKEKNNDFAKKYATDHEINTTDKKLSFSIALETDSNKQLINNEQNKIRLFCIFPLIGSECFKLPFILNSPFFEVATERDGIMLDGNLYDSENILTDRGINEIILLRSLDLFSVILNWLIDNDYTNFSVFANSIDNPFIFANKINKPFATEQNLSISSLFRNILIQSPIVKDSNGNRRKLNDVFFLDFNGIKNTKDFHLFSTQLFTNIASYDDCIQWKDLLWSKLNILTIDDFVENISLIGQNKITDKYKDKLIRSNLLNNLNSLSSNDFEFLNNLYSFLLQEEPYNIHNYSSRIWIYPIVLDSKSKLALFSNLKSSEKLPSNLKEIMSLCETWGNKLIHPQINSFSSIIQHATFNDALKELNQYLLENQNDDDLLLSLIKYIPKNNDNQIKIYKLAQKFFKNSKMIEQEIYVDDINESLWEKVDEYLLRSIQNISKLYNCSISDNELADYNIFYDQYQKFCRNTNFLVPNLNLILKKKEELQSISNNIPQAVLDIFKPYISFDLYVHPLITNVKFNGIYDLQQFIFDINNILGSNKDSLKAVLSVLPPSENQRLYKVQEKIRDLAQFFINIQQSSIQSNISDELFWKKANELVLEQIKQKFQSNNNVKQLSNALGKNEDEIFDHLNIYYSLVIQIGGSNWKNDTLMPNYYGNFLPVKNLSIVKDVPDEYLNFYNMIKNDSEIRESFAHSKINCDFLEVIDFTKFVDMICQNITDRQLINDENIQQGILQLNPFASLKNANNKLINKLYSINIGNVLNDIINPTENDKKRWIWELIEIAKDTLNKSRTHDSIDIEIFNNSKSILKKEFIFSHNGPCFTEKSLLQLIFALNPNKNSFSYRKYGDGLVSTHVLAKRIKINGNILQNDKVSGFSLLLNREGTNDDGILNDFKKIKKSIQYIKQPFEKTSFIYEINNN